MAFRADIGVHIEVIQKHEFICQLVKIGSDVFAEKRQRFISISFGHVAQNLIVGSILFDDVDDVLNGRRMIRPLQERIEIGSNKTIARLSER